MSLGGALLVSFAACVGSTPPASEAPHDPPSTDATNPPPTTSAQRLYGVTLDDVGRLSDITQSLALLPHRPTARIVFDEGQPASAYATAVSQIETVGDVMGEILDSEYVAAMSLSGYLARTAEYLDAFDSKVAIWEIANEINGNWVDTSAGGVADVVAKMVGAYDLVEAAGGRTALTLYGCSDADKAHDMLVWAAAHVPERMRNDVDYVLVSFYEGDCGVPAPDWPATFHQLRALFPFAALGFGEVGAVDANGNRITNTSIASAYLQRYYTMPISEPGYIGGHFWWYYVEDMLPLPSTMYSTLVEAIE